MKDPGNIILALVALIIGGFMFAAFSPSFGPARPGMSGAGSADLRRAIASGKPVLLEFSATWCGPCRMVRPEVEALSGEVGDKARVVMLDVDKSPEIGQAYGVRGIPCFIVLKNGKEASRMVGAIPKSEMRRMLGL